MEWNGMEWNGMEWKPGMGGEEKISKQKIREENRWEKCFKEKFAD